MYGQQLGVTVARDDRATPGNNLPGRGTPAREAYFRRKLADLLNLAPYDYELLEDRERKALGVC